ncbi:MAG TPA: DUF4349 domain-containing protein [Thermoanaerobaculia bacterium]|jgi:hypothetical protein
MRKLVVLLLVVACACTKAESGVEGAASDVTSVASAREVATKQAVAEPASARPMIVRSAEVRIVVADTSKAVEAITKSAEGAGGFVAGSQLWREGELLRARLTLRVPAARLTSTLASIRGVASRVENETISGTDVSQEYVDLASQLRNSEAAEVELRELLASVRQTSRKASEVLEVYQQLTAMRAQIEQTRGRIRYLSESAALSAVAVELVPDAIAAPVVQPGWQPLVVVRSASRALVAALQTMTDIAIWIVIYVVPIAGVVALLLFALWRLTRNRTISFRTPTQPS